MLNANITNVRTDTDINIGAPLNIRINLLKQNNTDA